MQYSALFAKNIDLKKFDEIIILYSGQEKEEVYLPTFLEEYKDKRIVLRIKDVEEFCATEGWSVINAIAEAHPEYNLAVCLKEVGRFARIDDLMQQAVSHLRLPYFFGYCATNFEQLHAICAAGVSDIYLAENICFDLTRAKQVCNNYNVQIRTFPNVAQSSVEPTADIKHFFIRPEDIELYSKYIDTFEFWGPLDRQETLLKIYQSGKWYGDLQPLILGLSHPLDGKRLLPAFGRARIDCRQSCLAGGACSICSRLLNITKLLEENNLIIQPSH